MFKNILVAIDLEHGTQIDNLLRAASDIANIQDAKVDLLYVIGAAPPDVAQYLPETYEMMASKKIKTDLAALAAKVNLAEGAATISVRFGDVYHEILVHADKTGVDLIIVASHKPAVSDYLLGTTAARIVRHASCSTLVVRQAG